MFRKVTAGLLQEKSRVRLLRHSAGAFLGALQSCSSTLETSDRKFGIMLSIPLVGLLDLSFGNWGNLNLKCHTFAAFPR
jgi:hypothetical protein